MRRKLVAGNWKMHGTRVSATELIETLLADLVSGKAECAICPPFVYLTDAARLLRGSDLALGAQDVCAESQGAYSGEVSASMLRDVGCRYTLVGHSERRALYAESDALVARKFGAAQLHQLVPILCVGESLAEREGGQTQAVIGRQLDAVLELCGVGAFAHAIVAYEPVWAIGTGRSASPDQAQEMHAFIRGRLSARDAKIGGQLRILYGGSVKAGNAAEIFAQPDVDGGLIGGASLQAEEFVVIVAAAG